MAKARGKRLHVRSLLATTYCLPPPIAHRFALLGKRDELVAVLSREHLAFIERAFVRSDPSRFAPPRNSSPSGKTEAAWFRWYNFTRWTLLRAVLKARRRNVPPEAYADVLLALDKASAVEGVLFEAHHPLAKRVVAQTPHSPREDADMLSDAAFALLRALRGFDWTRGFRFSTYAWVTVARALIRQTHAQRTPPMQLDDQPGHAHPTAPPAVDPDAGEVLALIERADLTPAERAAIVNLYGLAGGCELTARQLARAAGTSRQAVYMARDRGLAKLRESITSSDE